MAHYKVQLTDGSMAEFDSPRADLTKEQVQQVVMKHHPQSPQKTMGNKAYDFAQDTLPYLAAGGAGALAAPLAPETMGAAPIAAAGLGYAGAKSGLRGVGRMLGYEKPATLAQETKKTALGDLPMGMAMEGAPAAAKTVLESGPVRAAGRGAAELLSVLPGVEKERVMQVFKNPRSILPSFLGGPPSLKQSGKELGRLESRLGIPGIEEREGAEVLKVKPPTGMRRGSVKINNPDRDFGLQKLQEMRLKATGKSAESLEQAIAELKSALPKETDRQVAARVFDEMKQGKMPDMASTPKAIRGIDNRLQMMPQDLTTAEFQNKMLLGKFRKKLINHLSEMSPELQAARQNFATGKTREAFTSPGFGLMAQSGGGTALSKMGANRLIGPFALSRMASNPAMGALLAASQSPLALGVGAAGVGAATQAAESKLTPYMIKTILDKLRRSHANSGL